MHVTRRCRYIAILVCLAVLFKLIININTNTLSSNTGDIGIITVDVVKEAVNTSTLNQSSNEYNSSTTTTIPDTNNTPTLQQNSSSLIYSASNDKYNTTLPVYNTNTSILPSCKNLMTQQSKYSNGEFLSSTTVNWTKRVDGSRELDLLEICQLHRYTAVEARTCLKNQHLMMIGDSITRYQHISLAHFLHIGRYPKRFGWIRGHYSSDNCTHINEMGEEECSEGPSICIEKDFEHQKPVSMNGWQWFHSIIGGGNDGGVFNGTLECACSRESGRPTVENILYQASHDPITISYANEFGWMKRDNLTGFSFSGCSINGTCRRTLNTTIEAERRVRENELDWNEPLLEALQPGGALQTNFPPTDIVLYNRGVWGALKEDEVVDLMHALNKFSKRCIYKTMTSNIDRSKLVDPKESSYVKTSALQAGCKWLDYAHLTKIFGEMEYNDVPDSALEERNSIYWDTLHFNPWVYEELNNVLLNFLCNNAQHK